MPNRVTLQASPQGGSSDLVRQLLARNLLAGQQQSIDSPLELAGNVAQQGALAFVEGMRGRRQKAAEESLAQRLSTALAPQDGGGPTANPRAISLAQALLSDPSTRASGIDLATQVLTAPAKSRQLAKDVGGRQRFVDTGELAFPGAIPSAPSPEAVGNLILRGSDVDPALTAENQALELARREARGPLVEQSIGGSIQEKAEQKAEGGRLVKKFVQVDERAEASTQAIQQLQIAKAFTEIDDVNLLPGGIQGLANIAVNFGVPFSDDALAAIGAGQGFQGVIENLVLTKMQAQKGPQTENDSNRIQRTLASLGNTPDARAFLLSTAIALAERDIEQRDFFADYRDDPERGNGSLRGAEQAWRRFIGDVPLLGAHPDLPAFPVFFNEFKEITREDNPHMTDEQIMDLWKKTYG